MGVAVLISGGSTTVPLAVTWIRERPWRVGAVDGYVLVSVVLLIGAFTDAFYFNNWWNYSYWAHACVP